MRRTIIEKVNNHNSNNKKKLHEWIVNNVPILKNDKGEDKTQELLEYIYDQESIELTEEDFQKRKRVSNKIPNYERCCAKKNSGVRCTRKRKEGNYCGTHIKACPYGSYDDEDKVETEINIWLEEINGIYQYIDINNNIYSSEDINKGEEKPRIIGKCKNEGGKYNNIII